MSVMFSAGRKRELRQRYDTDRSRPLMRLGLDTVNSVEALGQRAVDLGRPHPAALPAGAVTAVIKPFQRHRQVRRLVASIQRVRVRGYSYWRIVKSVRVNGKPRIVVLAHLGKAADLLARLQAAEPLRLRSRSHVATTALYALARELDIAGTIDRHLAAAGRRDRRQPAHLADPRRTPRRWRPAC